MPNMIVIPRRTSALNLDIEGSVGSFSIKSRAGENRSVEVKYILSHVGLDFTGGHEEKLLSKLKPIREVFPPETLSFDEIMQRDIDDQRVSLDLISYLLEEGEKGLVKLFPPIVVVVVPIKEGEKKPDNNYPPVVTHPKTEIDGHEYKVIRSGKVGEESFEFSQMYLNGELSDHNYAKLKLNVDKNELAIVDGQHRAMALLGLYRNIKGWPDGTIAYSSYYKRWTKEMIQAQDLSELRLPLMVCVFPELDSSDGGRIKVTEACRAIFLALNKNARPVTRARNILLNDRDLIAEFMRDTLSIVKNQDEHTSVLNLFNIQLDAENDKARLSSDMALTGVMHLYTIIEKLMLNPKKNSGFSAGGNRLYLVKSMDNAFEKLRLNAKDIIGSGLARDTTRRNYLEDTKEKLVNEFHHRYSKNIIYCLENFSPYQIHAKVSREIKALVKSKSDVQAESILFDNQGVENVFKEFRDRVSAEIKELGDYGVSVPPGLTDSKVEFDSTFLRVVDYKQEFSEKRATSFFGKKVCFSLTSAAQDMYEKNFTTSAFQSGLLLTFYNMLEDYQENILGERVSNETLSNFFKEYIASLNKFFVVANDQDVKRVCRLFFGKYKGAFNSEEMKFIENASSLRSILIPGELSPNEWPKFRFIFLELWTPSNSDLNTLIMEEQNQARLLLYKSFCKRMISEHCSFENIEEENMHMGTKKSIYKKCKNELLDEINALELNRKIEDDTIFDIWDKK